MSSVRVVDYNEVDPFSFKLPTFKACDFSRNDRFQTVAIAGDRLVGRWAFTPNAPGGVISSSHTWVSGSYRRQGIAVQLWLAGVKTWSPFRIEASIASWNGAALLARMTVELAGRVSIDVTSSDWMPTYQRLLADCALRALVRERSERSATKPQAARLEVVQ